MSFWSACLANCEASNRGGKLGNGCVLESDSRIAIDFIDPLFAVVLHISFAEIILKEGWFGDFRLVWNEPNLFEVATLLLAYTAIIHSWIGYHRSINKNPIKLDKGAGQLRFMLDIVLLVAYFVLVVSLKNFQRTLWTLVFIYAVFFLWDQCKRVEQPETSEDKSARRGVTVFWLLIFTGLALFRQLHPPVVRYECEDWILLIGAAVALFMYRWHKNSLGWKPLLLLLGFPRFNG